MPLSACGPETGVAPMSTRPSVHDRSPAVSISRLLLPQPLGPTIDTKCPRGTPSVMSVRARTGPLAVG